MSPALVSAAAALLAGRPTPEGERALRDALGYIAEADAAATRRAYAGNWWYFHAWCLQVGLAPFPASSATIAYIRPVTRHWRQALRAWLKGLCPHVRPRGAEERDVAPNN